MPEILEGVSDYAKRVAERVGQFRAKWPAKYAEHECYAYLKLNPPVRYRGGPLPGFVQLVLDQLTAASIRDAMVSAGKWPDEKTWLEKENA